MKKEFKTILIRDIPPNVVTIMNQYGTRMHKKNGTDILIGIVESYHNQLHLINKLNEEISELTKTKNDFLTENLKHLRRLNQIRDIINDNKI